MKHLAMVLAILLICSIDQAFAAAWPDNWLGQPNNGYVTLNIGVFYYGAVIDDFPADDGTPALPVGTDWLEELQQHPEQDQASIAAELERIRWEMAEAARFYWRNTRFNLALDYEWNIEEQPIMRSSIASTEAPYHSPVDHPAYGDMRKEYDGLVQIMVLYKYDEETGTLERVVGGGGFTWGLDAETMECGWSWWAAPPASHACGSDWLMVHEFGHQVDSMFDESDHPEVWFNHLSPSEGNVARFGEHFDANAYILRRIPEADWGDLLWGSYGYFEDADEDNVPDYSDYFDTLGLLTDPDETMSDTDYDGLSDYDEFMASNGNRHGHDERLHPALAICDPNQADTDGDGLLDGGDPLPMLPVFSLFPRQLLNSEESIIISTQMFKTVDVPTTDGIPGLDFELSYTLTNSWKDEVNPGWLQFRLRLIEPVDMKLMLDLNNDGWFTGVDNYQVILSEGQVIKVIQHGTLDPIGWPQPNLLDIGSLELVPEVDTDGSPANWINLRFTQEHFPELAAKPGEMIGFNIGVKLPGENWYYMVGEPNTLIPLELR